MKHIYKALLIFLLLVPAPAYASLGAALQAERNQSGEASERMGVEREERRPKVENFPEPSEIHFEPSSDPITEQEVRDTVEATKELLEAAALACFVLRCGR